MINHIEYNNNDNQKELITEELLETKKRYSFSLIFIKCSECNIFESKKNFRKDFLIKNFLCSSCRVKGERNHFFGKKHSEESKLKQSIIKKEIYVGENNPFFGKIHSDKTKKNISKTLISYFENNDNAFLGKEHSNKSKEKMSIKAKEFYNSLSEEEKKERNEKVKIGVNRFQDQNPEYTKEIRRKACFASIFSNSKFKINKIETIVSNKLSELNLDFSYSVILGNFQYDFGNKENKILIEVQGDYWHANPKKYTVLNEIQQFKVEKDILKKEFALKHGFKLFYIWEDDIIKNNFSIMEEIKNEISKNI